MSCPAVMSYHVKISTDTIFGYNHIIISIGITKLSSVSKYKVVQI